MNAHLHLAAAFLILIVPNAAAQKVDSIVIHKADHALTLMSRAVPLRTYKVALGSHPVGAKDREGDGKTPEGHYIIDAKNARSEFHLSLHISYPNPEDRARARKLGVSPGGDVMIHGLAPSFAWLGPLHRQRDWTLGCVAVTNSEIDEIFRLASVGTPVEIDP